MSPIPTKTSPLPQRSEFHQIPPLPPLWDPQSVGKPPLRSCTDDQLPSPQSSLPHSEPPASPPPPRSPLDVPAPSRPGGAWECREREYILMEGQVERCLSRRSRSQDVEELGQCDFRIVEFWKDGYCLPTRRIAIRSCENGEQCISFCESPCVINVLEKCSMHLTRDAARQRTSQNRPLPSHSIVVGLFKHSRSDQRSQDHLHMCKSVGRQCRTRLRWAFSDTSRQNLIDDLCWNPRTIQVTLLALPSITSLIFK